MRLDKNVTFSRHLVTIICLRLKWSIAGLRKDTLEIIVWKQFLYYLYVLLLSWIIARVWKNTVLLLVALKFCFLSIFMQNFQIGNGIYEIDSVNALMKKIINLIQFHIWLHNFRLFLIILQIIVFSITIEKMNFSSENTNAPIQILFYNKILLHHYPASQQCVLNSLSFYVRIRFRKQLRTV